MKEQYIHEYPMELYNNMYGQIQYEMLESIKNAIKEYDDIDSETKETIINRVKQQIEDDKAQIKRMIELSNFQYNIREDRRRKLAERNKIRSYYLDYDYGFKLEYKDFIY